MNYTEKAIEIINTKGVKEWLKVREVFNLDAINNGYCVDIEGCCEEDRCDCVNYRGLTQEEAREKLNKRRNNENSQTTR